MKQIIITACLAAILCGCHCTKGDKKEPQVTGNTVTVEQPSPTPIKREPNARAFRMNGDYANHVPVLLSDDGTEPLWYPQINEVDSLSAPVALVNGYYLDRYNFNDHISFLNWTYAEYEALPSTPTPAEIMRNIIPDSHVMEVVQLPIGRYFAMRNPEMCDSILDKRYDEVITISKLVR